MNPYWPQWRFLSWSRMICECQAQKTGEKRKKEGAKLANRSTNTRLYSSVQLFLDRVHPNIPIINRSKLYEAAGGPGEYSIGRECLYDTVYTFAAAFSTQFSNIEEVLYNRARSTLERLEASGEDSDIGHIEHIQSWTLITHYEFSKCNYRRAWLSAGRLFRLVQLAKLSALDGPAGTVLHQDSDGGDLASLEEKRRTFWAVYCLDKLLGLSGDGPTTFDEHLVSRHPSWPTVLMLSQY